MSEPPAAQAVRQPGKTLLAGILALVVLSTLIWWKPPWSSRLQSVWFDAFQVLAPRQVESIPATVVAIDEKSLAALGQWPWPRTVLAALIRAIATHQPAAIGVNILMPEADRLSPERLLEDARNANPALARHLAALPSNDAELARTIAAAPVVLAVAGQTIPTRTVLRVRPFTVTDSSSRSGTTASASPDVPRFAGVFTNLDMLDRAAAGHGLISVAASNGMIRRIPLVFDVKGTLAPALPIEMLRIAFDAPALRLHVDGSSVKGISVGDVFAPTEGDGAVRVYFSHRDPRRYVSAIDVLDGTADPVSLRQKLVLIGTTGLGLVDFQNTPLGEPMPGSEIQAQLLENLFDQTLLSRPAAALAVELAVFVALGLLLIWATPRWAPRNATLLATACMLLPAVAAFLVYRSHRLLFDAATPGSSLAVLFSILLVLTLTEAARHRKSLERTLAAEREQAAYAAGELEAAQRIQTGMLPHPGLLDADTRIDLAATMIPAREVGGDLYDFFRLDQDRLYFLVGDVAGKGLSASMFMVVSKALCKSAALRAHASAIGELMSAANAEVSRDNSEMYFVTAFAGILDLETGELDYCNAGHENPFVLRSDNAPLFQLEGGGGPPLCVVDGFGYRGAHHRMRAGEIICLVSDGVVDAQDPAGERFGSARLRMALERARTEPNTADAVVAALRSDVESFAAGAEPADDITMLAVRWSGPGNR